MKRFISGLILILTLGSCYHSAQDPPFQMALVIPADSMVSLLTDIHLAEGILSNQKDKKVPTGHLSAEYFDVILKKHEISKESFEESMRYYAFHTEKLDDIYEEVIINLSKKESMITAQKEADTLTKDTLP